MNKSLLLSLILVAVVVISGCAYFGSDDTATSPQDKDKKEEKTEIKTTCGSNLLDFCCNILYARFNSDKVVGQMEEHSVKPKNNKLQ